MRSRTGAPMPGTRRSARAGSRAASRPAVAEAVRLHVPAKRYLCATDRGYFGMLSPASVHTLALQGGPMQADEIARFEREPYHRDAIRVRRWDDQGKVAGLKTAAIADYEPMFSRLAAAQA